ncbi:MAG TPA: LysR substrate-binding domain-containing protein [Steroidobacteraceae bacterium]|jgi:LysR family hydrogen peroxide-inducible transcriptional activator|nr:LysR substrate-binding domain-containing protein [Steroidobacteraceae bacterium]
MSDIKLKDLRYLVTVADTGHFGQAAERCFVSQPTLSAQLKKLEEYLGVKLIERHPRRATLTQAGEQIVARARVILRASDEVVTIAHTYRDPLAGRLKVAMIPTVGPYVLPRVAPVVRRQMPRLDLLLFEYQTAAILAKVHAGEIDVGVLALPIEHEGLASRKLYDEDFDVALPENHPLAKQATVRIADLADETLLLLEEGHCLRDQALEVCSRISLQERQDFRATSLETLRQMVAAGAGVTLMPQLASRGAYGSAGGVVIRPLVRPTPHRQVGAVWRRSSARLAAIDAFCNVLVKNAK